MKKLTLFSLLFFGILLNAQCNIAGSSTIKINSEETYSIANEIAQCKDCHNWQTVGTFATISGDNRQNSLKLKGNSVGKQVLTLSVITAEGVLQCSKNIEIVEHDPSTTERGEPNEKMNCGIKVNDFKEVKYSESMVAFFPLDTNDDYRYTWTATYFDGKELTSKEKVPQFPFSKTDALKNVKVQIIANSCIRKLSRNYDPAYWQYF